MNKYKHRDVPNPNAMSRHTGKHRFVTLEHAQKIARLMEQNQGKPFSVYSCVICAGYHIGHTPPQYQGEHA